MILRRSLATGPSPTLLRAVALQGAGMLGAVLALARPMVEFETEVYHNQPTTTSTRSRTRSTRGGWKVQSGCFNCDDPNRFSRDYPRSRNWYGGVNQVEQDRQLGHWFIEEIMVNNPGVLQKQLTSNGCVEKMHDWRKVLRKKRKEARVLVGMTEEDYGLWRGTNDDKKYRRKEFEDGRMMWGEYRPHRTTLERRMGAHNNERELSELSQIFIEECKDEDFELLAILSNAPVELGELAEILVTSP